MDIGDWIYNRIVRPLTANLDAPCHACADEEEPCKDWRDCDCEEGRIAREHWEQQEGSDV